MAGFDRNGWPTFVGIGGRIASESVAGLHRLRKGAEDELVVAAPLGDIGDLLAPKNTQSSPPLCSSHM